MKLRQIKYLVLALWTVVFLVLVGGSLASAGTWCGQFSLAEVENKLASDYGEARVGAGRASDDKMVHLFISEDRTTWTVVFYNGRTRGGCITYGDTWIEFLFRAPPEEVSDERV